MSAMTDEPQSPLYRWTDAYTREQHGVPLGEYVRVRRIEHTASWDMIAMALSSVPGGGPTAETLRRWFGKDPK